MGANNLGWRGFVYAVIAKAGSRRQRVMEVSVQSSVSIGSAKSSEPDKDINISDLDISLKKNGLNGSANIENHSNEKLNTLKKRISSSKTPNRTRETTKAKRVRFFRNGDKFWTGYLVAVSNERYK